MPFFVVSSRLDLLLCQSAALVAWFIVCKLQLSTEYIPPLPRYVCAQVLPSRESVTNDLGLVLVKVGQSER